MKVLLLIFLQALTFAGGAAGGSITDLMVPAGNFILVFGFIFWKLKPMIKRHFEENSVKIKELVELAHKRDKEAQIKLESYQEKMNNVSNEVEKIISDAKKDADNFEQSHIKEMSEAKEKATKDSAHKLESEKNMMVRHLNESLLDEVISLTKNKISNDNSLNGKATAKLLKNI